MWTQNRLSYTVCHQGFLNISADEKSTIGALRVRLGVGGGGGGGEGSQALLDRGALHTSSGQIY